MRLKKFLQAFAFMFIIWFAALNLFCLTTDGNELWWGFEFGGPWGMELSCLAEHAIVSSVVALVFAGEIDIRSGDDPKE